MNGGLDNLMLAGFVRGAVKYAQTAGGGATPTSVLQDILAGTFTLATKNGRVLISSAEAGGSAAWTIPSGIGPDDLTRYASAALALLEEQDDPDNPDVAAMFRRVTRLRVSFGRTIV